MSSIRIAFHLSFGICFAVWTLGAAAAPFENLILAQGGDSLRLPNGSLIPTIRDPFTNPQVQAPAVQVSVSPVAAIANATMPATIRAMRVDLVSSEKLELRRLTARLSEIDTAIVWYQHTVAAESFYNLLKTLTAFAAGSAPNLSSTLEQFRWTIVPLLTERKEIERRIFGIEHPGGLMIQGPHVYPVRSGPDGNYEVYRSVEPATGAVVAPTPPPCRQEERTHRQYRMMLEPNGFDARGTPLFRNVYHPFPITERVTICN